MRTVTIDIINQGAIKLLQNLEDLQLIRMHNQEVAQEASQKEVGETDAPDWAKFKGSLPQQSKSDIDQQLAALRKEWD